MSQQRLKGTVFALLAACSTATARADAIIGSTGGLKVDVAAPTSFPIISFAKATWCLHADANGVIAAAGYNGRQATPEDPTACNINVLLGAWAGVYGGQGRQGVSKDPMPGPAGAVAGGTIVIVAGGTHSQSGCTWSSTRKFGPLGIPIGFTVTMTADADVFTADGGATPLKGVAVGHCADPWIFEVEEQSTIHLTVTTESTTLSAHADVGDARAATHAFGGLGRGETPGEQSIVTWDFFRAVQRGEPDLALGPQTLVDQDIVLVPNQTYWLAGETQSGGRINPVVATVPTLPDWGLIALVIAILCAGTLMIRRRASVRPASGS